MAQRSDHVNPVWATLFIPMKAKQFKALVGKLSRPDARVLVEEILRQVGGMKELARLLVNDLKRAPAGGMFRAKLMTLIIDTVNFTTDKHATDDVGLLTDDEIDKELDFLVQRAGIAPDVDDAGTSDP